jgi:hypothetical protein
MAGAEDLHGLRESVWAMGCAVLRAGGAAEATADLGRGGVNGGVALNAEASTGKLVPPCRRPHHADRALDLEHAERTQDQRRA